MNETDLKALRATVARGYAAQTAIDRITAEADEAALAAIHVADDDRVRARLIREYWHDGDRADRTPRGLAYLHLGLLSGILDRVLAERNPTQAGGGRPQ